MRLCKWCRVKARDRAKAHRAEKKAAGLCIEGACQARAVNANHCEEHRERQRAKVRRSRAKRKETAT